MIDHHQIQNFKTRCTTTYAGLLHVYPRVLNNSVQPSLRNAMNNFRGEKEEKEETVQNQKVSKLGRDSKSNLDNRTFSRSKGLNYNYNQING